jgi:ribosomal protein L11 methyltransferase
VHLAVRVPAEDAERAVAEAAATLGTGCRQGADAGGAAVLDFWVPAAEADPEALERLLHGAGIDAAVAARDDDGSWRDAMRAFHRPVEIAGRLLVRPPWEPPRPPLLDVEIEPGMAFGTAQHATTRACLALLAEPAPGGSLLDVGCGSGVLAIAARRLGFDPVWALDADPLAVDATLANARRNRVGLRVARRVVGADRLPVAGTVTANLTATVLVALAEHLPEPAPRRLVASGMRPEEVAGVAGAFARRDLRPSGEVVEDGWATVLLERP